MTNSTQVKSIGANIRSIIKTSINIPLELLSVTAEITNDVVNLTSTSLREVLPTTKAVLSASTNFAVGAANSSLTEQEVEAKVRDLNFASVRDSMVKSSAKYGQSTTKAFSDFFAE
jgi:hypothetical protein